MDMFEDNGYPHNGGSDDLLILKLDHDGNLIWGKQYGDTTKPASIVSTLDSTYYDERCLSVAVDSLGQIYCAGYTKGSMSENRAGDQDAIILKLDGDGNEIWFKQFGQTTKLPDSTLSNNGDQSCIDIDIDENGNVYCLGTTSGSMGELYYDNNDPFVLKTNSSGDLQWIRQFGNVSFFPGGKRSSYSYDNVNSMDVDSAGNVYCAGSTLVMGGANGSPADTHTDAMIFKLTTHGELDWITQLGGKYSDKYNLQQTDGCRSIKVSDDGEDIYCAGYTNSHLIEPRSDHDYVYYFWNLFDLFLMKVSKNGELKWARNFGEKTMVGRDATGSDECVSLDVDSSGYIYCGGYTDATREAINDVKEQVSFGGALGESAADGNRNLIIMKYKDEDL